MEIKDKLHTFLHGVIDIPFLVICKNPRQSAMSRYRGQTSETYFNVFCKLILSCASDFVVVNAGIYSRGTVVRDEASQFSQDIFD